MPFLLSFQKIFSVRFRPFNFLRRRFHRFLDKAVGHHNPVSNIKEIQYILSPSKEYFIAFKEISQGEIVSLKKGRTSPIMVGEGQRKKRGA